MMGLLVITKQKFIIFFIISVHAIFSTEGIN